MMITRLLNLLLHQNICGLSNKIYEFQIALSPTAPQDICLTEHNLIREQIETVKFHRYSLEASSSRKTYTHGGTCIYVSKDIQFHTINLEQFNSEKDIEICTLRLNLASCSFTIICIYRSPQGTLVSDRITVESTRLLVSSVLL